MNNILLGGRYELLEKIGEGGMSEVYKAKCTKLNRFVAVKILKKEFSENEDISNKFRKEAAALAKLSESNIVNVLDVGNENDMEYFVMEYIDGKTLKDIIKYHGKLSYQTTIKVGLQIAKGLECAHKNNIIHRDVKPQNILVTENGEVKITDFGIAKSTTSDTITNTQTIVGSAHYFSPEQAKGSFIDSRSDIYSLGVVLYEMVTGVLPFDGESPVTIALKHIQDTPVSPKILNSAIPESLNKIILKCINKDPNLRYSSMKELSQDLQRVQDNPDILISNQKNEAINDRTIIMPSMNNIINDKSNKASKSLKEEYYDDEDYVEDEEDDEPLIGISKGKKRGIIIGICIAVILIFFVIGFYFLGGAKSPKEVAIPNIMNISREEAKAKLEELKLVYREVHVDDTSDKPEGTILEVDPKVGTMVMEGTEVRVTVSAGIETYEMPSFKENNKEYVIQWLKQKGIEPTIEEEFSDDIEKGKILDQEPAAGEKINKNTDVKIIVSKGKEIKTNKVPDLKGKTKEEADKILKELGFEVYVSIESVQNLPEDNIVLDMTNIGSELAEGTQITIVVGEFKINPLDYIKVGQTLGKAQTDLAVYGIKIKVTSTEAGSDAKDAIITDIEPTPVKPGGVINVRTEPKKTEEPKPDNPPPTQE